MDAPQTLLDAVRHFSDYQNCHDFMVALRWPTGVTCPTCGSDRVTWLAKQRRWKCRTKHARQQFTLKTGTIFEDSPLPLAKWLPAVWIVVNCKNGVSSYELARSIGVTQKSAWFIGHCIRLALQAGSFAKLTGEVEVDETFIGGKARNMHLAQRRRRITGRGGSGKTAVLGVLKRGGEVRALVVEDREAGYPRPLGRRQAPLDSIAWGQERAGVTPGQVGLSPVEKLGATHDVDSFECGKEPLDRTSSGTRCISAIPPVSGSMRSEEDEAGLLGGDDAGEPDHRVGPVHAPGVPPRNRSSRPSC